MTRSRMFADRDEAGRRLAALLTRLRGQPIVVLGLPRGGIPVAEQVARSLGAPLDAIIVRKLGVPWQPELAMGAVGEDGVMVTSPDVIQLAGVTQEQLDRIAAREQAAVAARAERYRTRHRRLDLTGKTAVVVDDGIATGATARAACQVARQHGASRVILAVPVAPPGSQERFCAAADEFVCVATPPGFAAIGEFYENFSQVSDDEVMASLDRAQALASPAPSGQPAGHPRVPTVTDKDPTVTDKEVTAVAGATRLPGYLTIPARAPGVVIFAHGSGSSRHSPRNQFVAGVLAQAGLGTLLFDLLTPAEAADRANVFDIALLSRRLVEVTTWLRTQPGAAQAALGYFGASTGAAAALRAAADPAAGIAAVVSRGGRPDLTGPQLAAVTAPTLLIVGGRDAAVLDLNRQAAQHLHGVHEIAVVPGATHLFEEEGTLAAAAGLARDWFLRYLIPR